MRDALPAAAARVQAADVLARRSLAVGLPHPQPGQRAAAQARVRLRRRHRHVQVRVRRRGPARGEHEGREGRGAEGGVSAVFLSFVPFRSFFLVRGLG